VTLAVERLAIRGELPPATLDVRYTQDGTAPTPSAPKYSQPFVLTAPATVKMLVLRDGKPWLTSEARFQVGLPPIIEDPRYEHAPATNQTFAAGPLDKEVVGDWVDGRRRLQFDAEGRVWRTQAQQKLEVARWWYDYPNDPYEEPGSPGRGQIRWNNNDEIVEIRLSGEKLDELLIQPDSPKPRRLKRN
jgi:hypothetical protein